MATSPHEGLSGIDTLIALLVRGREREEGGRERGGREGEGGKRRRCQWRKWFRERVKSDKKSAVCCYHADVGC